MKKPQPPITYGDLTAALAAVKYGYNPVAARNLIEYFHTRFCDGDIESGEIGVLLQFVAHAFSQIVVENYSADHAFGLKLKRGKYKRPDTFERDIEAAARIVLLMRDGKKWEEAKEETASMLFPDKKGERAVESAYAYYRDFMSILPNETLSALLGSAISRDMAV